MTPFFITIMFFFLVGAACMGVYMAMFSNHRALEERLADLALKMRISQGAFDDEAQDETLGRMIFRWAAKRIPPPKMDTPQGEKLAQTLAQAGFIKSGAPQIFQVIRVFSAIGGGVLALIFGALFGSHGGQMIVFGAAGVAGGLFIPSYYISRRARKRQTAISRQLSDVLDLLVVCVEAGLGLFEAIKIVGTEAEKQ
ncbi:MAG TPA: hypothetical protein VLL57_05835, partial [Candidatus Binataceae bacterium]|nr:hypothetical protein [Candidatus Binataceae bacterium]